LDVTLVVPLPVLYAHFSAILYFRQYGINYSIDLSLLDSSARGYWHRIVPFVANATGASSTISIRNSNNNYNSIRHRIFRSINLLACGYRHTIVLFVANTTGASSTNSIYNSNNNCNSIHQSIFYCIDLLAHSCCHQIVLFVANATGASSTISIRNNKNNSNSIRHCIYCYCSIRSLSADSNNIRIRN